MKKQRTHKILSVLLSLVMVLSLFSSAVYADEGTGLEAQDASAMGWDSASESSEELTIPAHGMYVTGPGEDGSYTVSLDVTGKSVQKTTVLGKADVVVVLDRSGSMSSKSGFSTRMQVAVKAIDGLAAELLANNTQDNPDAVKMSLVEFSTRASVVTAGETNYTSFMKAVRGAARYPEGGTNWEAALAMANSVPTRPNAAKYVIFISDGDPTFRSSSYGHKDYNMYYHAYGTGDSDPHGWNFAAAIPYAKAIVDYGKQLYFVSGFFSGKMGELAKAAYDGFLPGGRYYSAFDADSLTKAFSDILCEINANSSYKDVVIKDQLTNGMRAVVGAHGVEFTYTKTTYVDGKKITKVWKNAPLAVYNPLTNEVVWNLSAIGTLDASTTYTVSFKVMPEQDLIDYVADVINGVRSWNNEAYNCLIRNLDGTFSLKVAKDARVYFRHLHMVNGQQFVSLMRWAPYANCFIHIGGENYLPWMNLTKIWADNHAADRPEVVTGTILRDGQAWVKVNLSARENYSKRIVTSWNHEYSFEEEETGNYTFSVEPVVAPFAKSYRLVVTNTLATGMISLTVKAEADEGLTPPEATFHYVLTLTDADGNPVAGEFPLFIDGVEVGTIGNGGTIDLQDGQSALIINVPAGTNYKFEQTEVPGFTTTSTGEVGAVPSGDTAAVEFVNHYSAVPAEGLIAVKKVVSGDGTVAIPDITGQYTFTLTAEDGAPLPEETVKTNPDADGGMILFGKIIFEKPGVYNYTVTESGEVDGFVNDSVSTKQVTIVVTDSQNGHLAANYSVTIKDPLVFTNYYAQTAASITVRKDLAASFGTIVPSMEGKFTFTLEAVDGAPLPEVTSYTNPCAYGGTMVFGDIVFDQAGVYTYKITETGSADGVTNDAEPVKTVQVVVTENNGKLEAVVNGGKEVVFTNTYQAASVTVPVQVKKAIYHCFEGTHAPDISNAYTFTLATVNGAPLPEKTVMTNPDPDGGVMDFGTVTFTKPGIYIYKVMETGHVDGFINDPTYVKTFVVYVKDNGSGQLEAKITSKEDRTYFLNFYHPTVAVASIPVTKILSAPEGVSTPDITKAFAFVISAASGTPMPEKTTILNPAADGGTAFFSNIRYEEPGTYTYKIKEYGKYRGITNDPVASKVVKVVVTDDGNGALVATVNDGEDVTFVNTYNVTPVKGCIHFSKVITAAEGYQAPDITDQFTFHVEAVNDGPMPNIGTMTNPDADGGDMYFGYFTFTQPGVYKYVIKETGSVPGVTNDPQDKEFEFVVTDNGKGGLDVTCEQDYKIVFVNTYGDFNPKSVEAELKVSKSIIGQEEGDIVPDITGKYTFTVTADEGTPLPERTSVTNPDPDGGVMSFGKVTFTAPGTYSYTFSESGEVEGITNDYVGSRVLTIEVVDDGEGNLKINTNLENPIAFVNIFNHEDTDSASTLICVHKHLYSSVTTSIVPDLTGKYTFTLSAPEGTPMPKVTEVTNPDRLGGSMTFGFVRFTQPGVYHYTVTETGHVPSVANDPVSTREIDAVVERGADGKLTAHMEYHNANGNNEAVIFTNVFAPAALYNETAITGAKVISGRDMLPGETYTFVLSAADDTTKQAIANRTVVLPEGRDYAYTRLTGAVDGVPSSFQFGAIAFIQPGTYRFAVIEYSHSGGNEGGMAYDDSTCYVEVVVSEKDGKLVAESEGNIMFVNNYSAEGSADISGTKQLRYVAPTAVTPGAVVVADSIAETAAAAIDNTAEEISTSAQEADEPEAEQKDPSEEGEKVLEEAELVEGAAEAADAEEAAVEAVGVVEMIVDATKAAAEQITEAPETEEPVKVVKDDAADVVESKDDEPAEVKDTEEVVSEPAETETESEPSTTDEDKIVPTSSEQKQTTVAATVAASTAAASTAAATTVAESTVAESTAAEMVADPTVYPLSLSGGEFSFEVRYATGDNTSTVVSRGTNGAAAAGETASINFSSLHYSTQGSNSLQNLVISGAATKDVVSGKTVYTIPYVVTEAASSNPGMGRNTQVFTFTVKVTDNADGTLSTSVSKSEAIAFVNNYITNTSTVSIDGLKKIEGGRPMKAGEFQFEISGNGPLPSNTIVSNDEGGAVRFGNIEFTKADLGDATEKTFSYTVHELGSKPGVTNDSDKHFTITVTDDGQGHLKAVLNGDNPLFTFTNTYKPTPGSSSVTSQVEVVKNLVGRELKAGEFQFVMKYLNGTTVATGTNDANGKVTLGEVSFADPGEFAFQIYEVPGNETNMTYDSSVINVAAKVTDNYDGKPLQVTWIYGGEAPLTFTNNYTEATGQLVVTKQVAGTGADSAKEFTFTVTLSQALNGTYGDMVFKNGVAVITLKAGDTVTASGLPIGVTYTVEENDYSADGYTTNAEGATGTIKADVISVASFVNTKNESQTEESSSSTDESTGSTEESSSSTDESTGSTEESSSSTDESTGSTEESSSSTGESTGSTEESTAAQSSTAQTRGNNKDNDKTVKTGDNTNMVVWLTLMAVAVVGVVTLLLFRRRKNNYK